MKKNKKLKVLMFNRWVGYNEGGNETHIKELALFLSRKGHTVDIMTTGSKALDGIREYIRDIIEIVSPEEYFTYSSRRFYYSLKYLVDSFVQLNMLLKKRKYDVVTVHFSIEAFIMRFIRLVYGVPYVLILVGDTDLELIEGKRANNTSQLTHYMAKECEPYGYYPEILTKGVDRRRFNKQVDGQEVRKKYIKEERQFLVLTVCRLDPRKNIETLVEAAKILEESYKDVFKFVVVGGGVEEKKLKDMVKRYELENSVSFTGVIPSTSDLLTKHYAAADVFALPTLYEGFGYVFSEAMAFGLPVIGTDTSAVPEVIKSVGILIPMKSPQELAVAIYRVYSDKNYREDMSKKSIEKVEEWYWGNLIDDYEKFMFKGIENFRKESTIFNRIAHFFSDILMDIPKIIFIGLLPVLKPKNKWGSVLQKQ